MHIDTDKEYIDIRDEEVVPVLSMKKKMITLTFLNNLWGHSALKLHSSYNLDYTYL